MATKSSGRGVTRETRLANKLRENLKRRKGKERSRPVVRGDEPGDVDAGAGEQHDDRG